MLGRPRPRARGRASARPSWRRELGRTQTMLGFADLVEFDTSRRQARRSSARSSSAPPTRCRGSGSASPRSATASSRPGAQDLEVAVGLDSNDALLRSYLGKAYFEEKRDDARRPAVRDRQGSSIRSIRRAYLYEAISSRPRTSPARRSTTSRSRSSSTTTAPSIARACCSIQDRASRGTSLARIYNDLGFTTSRSRRGDEIGRPSTRPRRALTASSPTPTSTSGGAEIARVSELLQAQMLQDININPVQPSLSETNLNIITQGGPARAGFNEFTPLFEQNQVAGQRQRASAATRTPTAARAWSRRSTGRYSASAGAFDYRTDGWRKNNDNKQNIERRLLPGGDNAGSQCPGRVPPSPHRQRRSRIQFRSRLLFQDEPAQP